MLTRTRKARAPIVRGNRDSVSNWQHSPLWASFQLAQQARSSHPGIRQDLYGSQSASQALLRYFSFAQENKLARLDQKWKSVVDVYYLRQLCQIHRRNPGKWGQLALRLSHDTSSISEPCPSRVLLSSSAMSCESWYRFGRCSCTNHCLVFVQSDHQWPHHKATTLFLPQTLSAAQISSCVCTFEIQARAWICPKQSMHQFPRCPNTHSRQRQRLCTIISST